METKNNTESVVLKRENMLQISKYFFLTDTQLYFFYIRNKSLLHN